MTPGPLTVLVIDDRPDNLTTVKAVLADIFPSVRVLTALDGRTGLGLAKAEKPDVILLDLVMPEMDGFEVCRQLKSDDGVPDTPVVILTALRTDQAARVQALEHGADGFLAKPVDEAELTAQIKAMAKIGESNRRRHRETQHLAELVAQRTAALESELTERRRADRELRQANESLVRSQTAMLNVLYDLKKGISDRAAAESNLRQSETRFRALSEQLGDGFELLDDTGRFLDANEAALHQTGYTKSELLAANVADIDASLTRERYHALFETLRAGAPTTFEAGRRRKDGTTFPVEITMSSVRFGDRTQCIMVVRDITERRRFEHRLVRLNECLIGLGADAAVNIQRLVELYGDQSGAVCCFYSRLADERASLVASWSSLPDYVPNEASDEVLCRRLVSADSDRAIVMRNLAVSPFAQTIPAVGRHGVRTCAGHVVRDAGKAVGALCALYRHDADPGEDDERFLGIVAAALGREEERERTGAELRQERDRARNYLDTVEAIIVALDREGRITMINRKGCRLLGRNESELIGQNWFATCVPQSEESETVRACFPELIAGNLSQNEYLENAILASDGGQRLIAWHNALLRDPQGLIVGTLSGGLDITASRAAETQVSAQLSELRRWHDLTLGRETRILELKREVNEALARATQPPRYETAAEEDSKQ